ncbi:MAG: hypothetical protein IPF53_05220 [Blastocatellia bacterium]|jgi:hypothetical protein|nr:hypothetical protein [Blastocatellia bacterium]MBK6428872.1 hypothetical protein [Blastocatellia bacterium]
MSHDDLKSRISAVEEELRELQLSIDTTRTHGLVYYSLLVVILFVGFAIGYATHTLFGVVLTAAGLALVAWREVGHYRERVAAIDAMIVEKRQERQSIDDQLRGSDKAG